MLPTLRSGFSGPCRPPPALNSILATFDCFTFPSHFYREHYGFEWVFFTHRRFLPYGPSLYSCHNLLLSRLLWKPAVLPWHLQGFMLILETGPGHLLICFTANHNLEIPNNTYLNRTNYYHELLVVKNLVICSLLVSNSFRLFKVICKDYKNTLNRTCTGNNRFDETAHQRYFEKGATRKAAKHHRKQSIFN